MSVQYGNAQNTEQDLQLAKTEVRSMSQVETFRRCTKFKTRKTFFHTDRNFV